MKSNPRTFQRVCNTIYVLICLASILVFAASWLGPGFHMMGFPILFFLGALLNFLTACLKFRRDGNRKNQKLPGLFFLLVTFFLLALSYVAIICIW